MMIDKIKWDQKYSSKIILIGEYGVIHGGEILASPLGIYSAKWVQGDPDEYTITGLKLIYDYLLEHENKTIDLPRFLEAIESGIYLKSNIPSGYGLGSSGSITAAIYQEFAVEKALEFDQVKQDLIEIESCFHGVSSGIDPLVIYLDRAIHISKEQIQVLDEKTDMSNYFLLDTHKHRKTGSLVDQYIERANQSEYNNAIEDYKVLNAQAIDYQLSNNKDALARAISNISRWQYEYLDFAILDEYRELWKSTLNRSDVSLKLCGAGGGGFIMGYAENVDAVIEEFGGKYDLMRLG